MRYRHSLCLAIAAVVTAATGCGQDDSGPATPAIDVSALDSGNYASVPRDAETIRSDQTGAALEAVRIGEHVPLPVEIDGRFAFQRLVNTDRRLTPDNNSTPYSIDREELPALLQGYVTGWAASAERRAIPAPGRSVEMQVLRFTDANHADEAARRFAERQAANLPGEAVSIPGFPKARAKWSPSKKYLDAWLTQDALLMYVHMDDPLTEPPEAAPLVAFVQKAFTDLVDALKGYSPSPLDKLGTLPLDPEGLLGRALPLEDGQKRKYDQSVVMPAQAALHFERHPGMTLPAFADAKVDLVAYSGGRVYRTANADAAERLLAAFTELDASGYTPMDGPPKLPTAKCFDTKDKKSNSPQYPPVCFVIHDRYVARVTATNTQQLHQKAAAQYKLLAYQQ
ncbi:hypothetical protein APR12_002962 [Nocardia amikacinitolerans]|uniref:DUF7373 family lipoprotein n=1 Tax=Nocardia amikacinitolerans TaxID=756689 RepID=UPI000A6BCEE9|nr:hypothetical protein [Nocardia amikacinitolerans]MCP2317616.1 hypothetical protein [Nocardia amikacinitolerans]